MLNKAASRTRLHVNLKDGVFNAKESYKKLLQNPSLANIVYVAWSVSSKL